VAGLPHAVAMATQPSCGRIAALSSLLAVQDSSGLSAEAC